MNLKTILLPAILIFTTSTGCIDLFSSSSPKAMDVEIDYKPRISKEWHKYFLSKLSEDTSITQGWALFSYGGWSNDGQVMLFEKEGKLLIEYADKGLRVSAKNEIIRKEGDLSELAGISEYENLNHVDEAIFDSLNFEYLSVKSGSSKPVHVFIRAADFSKHPKHQALIKIMNKFKK